MKKNEKPTIITGNKVFARKMIRIYLSFKSSDNNSDSNKPPAHGFNALYGKKLSRCQDAGND